MSEHEKLLDQQTDLPLYLKTWRRFLVFPILFVYMLSYMMSFYTVTEYTNKYWRDKKLEEANLTKNTTSSSTCNVNTSSLGYKAETAATEIASRYLVYYSLCQGIPAVISNIVLGSFTDSYGRKFLFAIGISGTALRLVLSVLIIHFKLDLLMFLVACFIEGCTGQYSNVMQVSFIYTADITTKDKRTYGMALLMATLALSLTCGSFSSGYLIQHFGFFVPMLVPAVLLIINLIVIAVFLPESWPKEKRSKNVSLCKVIRNSASCLIDNDVGNNRWKFRILFIAHAFTEFSFLGRTGTDTLYQMAQPFCWSPEKVGIYAAIRTGLMISLGISSVKILKTCMPDVIIAVLGVSSYGASFILTAFAKNDLMLYAVLAVSIFAPLESTMIRAISSSLTDPKKQGAMFSALAGVDITVNLLSNVGIGAIYSLTVSFMGGFVYLVMAAFDVVAIVLLIILFIGWRAERGRNDRTIQALDD